MPFAHLKPPTVDGIIKRYRERSHDYCYWSHEEYAHASAAMTCRATNTSMQRKSCFATARNFFEGADRAERNDG